MDHSRLSQLKFAMRVEVPRVELSWGRWWRRYVVHRDHIDVMPLTHAVGW